ncbi:MAG: dual specificity protein phosphatase family protein [Candidatus Omnitrophica bacterium]|nr:dual specificity protein phosphatase family protein [Candidatus Omnitrophota bacterium]
MLNGFYWIVENEMAGMALPTAARAYLYLEDADKAAQEELNYEISQLKEMGIGAVVTLTEYPLAGKALQEAGIHYLHIPVPDMTAPTQSQIAHFIKFSCEKIKAKRPVAVHCLGGAGRTGTMGACYLVYKGFSPEDAIAAVRRLRPGSIETLWQEQAIFEFSNHRNDTRPAQ